MNQTFFGLVLGLKWQSSGWLFVLTLLYRGFQYCAGLNFRPIVKAQEHIFLETFRFLRYRIPLGWIFEVFCGRRVKKPFVTKSTAHWWLTSIVVWRCVKFWGVTILVKLIGLLLHFLRSLVSEDTSFIVFEEIHGFHWLFLDHSSWVKDMHIVVYAFSLHFLS